MYVYVWFGSVHGIDVAGASLADNYGSGGPCYVTVSNEGNVTYIAEETGETDA